jgi:hypothetical protein
MARPDDLGVPMLLAEPLTAHAYSTVRRRTLPSLGALVIGLNWETH